MKRTDYINWDEYFMGIALLTAMRSKDPNSQVGACIVSSENKILSLGYNGMPIGCSDDEMPWEREGAPLDTKYMYVCHAELNAILNSAHNNLKGARVYVTLFPCNECTKAIIQSGIAEVVYYGDKYHDSDSSVAARFMFKKAGVKLTAYQSTGRKAGKYTMSLKNRSFLKLLDYTPAEIEELLDLAADLKAKKKAGIRHNDQLAGKNIALIFEKTSTRTRCSFEVAAHDLGMEVTYLDPSGSQIGKKESIADTARVLGRMFDGIEYRGYGQQIVEDLAHYAGVPVWNGLTNEFHPTQILADFLTIREHFGHLKGINFVYFGDARYNMGNSLMVGCAKMGLNFTACAPKKYQPDAALVAECQKIAAETGATLTFEEDSAKAAKGADVLYTDVWVSMGEPVEVWAERINDLAAYQINQQLMDIAGPHAVFMHCLPAFHDHKTTVGKEMGERFGRDAMEVTDEVFEGPQSIVFDEAENRMHTIKAVMAATLGYVK